MSWQKEAELLHAPPEAPLGRASLDKINSLFDAGATIDRIREETDGWDDWIRWGLRKEGRIPASNPFPRIDDLASTPNLLEELSEDTSLEAQLRLTVLSETIGLIHEAAKLDKGQNRAVWRISEHLENRYGLQVSSSYISLLAGAFGANLIYYITPEDREEYKREYELMKEFSVAVMDAYDEEPDVVRAAEVAGCTFKMASEILRREGYTYYNNPFERSRTDVYIPPNDETRRREAHTQFIRDEAGLVYSTLYAEHSPEVAEVETANYLRRKYGLEIPVEDIARKVRHYNRVHPLQRDIEATSEQEALATAWGHYRDRVETQLNNYIQDILSAVHIRNEKEGITAAAKEFGLPADVVRSLYELIALEQRPRVTHVPVTPEKQIAKKDEIVEPKKVKRKSGKKAKATKTTRRPDLDQTETGDSEDEEQGNPPALAPNHTVRAVHPIDVEQSELTTSQRITEITNDDRQRAEARIKQIATLTLDGSPTLTTKDLQHEAIIVDALSTVLAIMVQHDNADRALRGNLLNVVRNRLPDARFPGLADRVMRHAESINSGQVRNALQRLASEMLK